MNCSDRSKVDLAVSYSWALAPSILTGRSDIVDRRKGLTVAVSAIVSVDSVGRLSAMCGFESPVYEAKNSADGGEAEGPAL